VYEGYRSLECEAVSCGSYLMIFGGTCCSGLFFSLNKGAVFSSETLISIATLQHVTLQDIGNLNRSIMRTRGTQEEEDA
jgi:hypothetical protein